MSPKPEHYAGREQTYIKHLFLSEYLRSAAYKLIQRRNPILNFVDGFAGPWEANLNAGYQDTSFAQSIAVLQQVRDDLKQSGTNDARVRFYFCEKKASSFAKLKAFADAQRDVEIHLFKGRFEDNLDAISAKINGGFTFTFVDPTGFKVGSKKICEFLKEQRGEFLFNFMSDHINRFRDFDDVENAYAELLADASWRTRYEALPANLSGEERVLALLKDVFRDLGAAKFVPDFAMMKPSHERLQMRLVLGTNSAEGVSLFRITHKRVELRERKIRTDKKMGDEPLLFSSEYLAETDQAALGFGCAAQKGLAADHLLAELEMDGPKEFDDLWPNVLELALLTQSDVKDVLAALKRDGKIAFELPQGKRKVQPKTLISAVGERLLF